MAHPKTLFSVIIPAYNYGKTLGRALESVLCQSGSDYEVLVINDGSTDNTEVVLDELHAVYPGRFRSVSRSNCGLAATRNYGIHHTGGEWLIFLDSDDELDSEALSNLRSTIEANPHARMVVGGHMSVSENGSSRYRGVNAASSDKMSTEELFAGYLLRKTVTPSNGATAMHRTIFEKVIYPEHFRNSEDIPVFACVFANYPCAFVEKPINRVYKHGDSLRHNTAYAHAVGAQLIDAVFDRRRIPESLQKYRQQFTAQRCLSLFRTLYMAGERKSALSYYRVAIKSDWSALFKLSYTRKALKCFLGQ
ncbi:glycosyltransferase family 2 protein [Parendozoicomonas sp. Alg238-R29]|uniref:glycosyltransferase family 2 protein n=1 Tax=Parendozoicomonas sp. Alg238-R29 TaxID=2993446 RepID=UPI00248F009D|nr:glycosyltransferase family 2 protein [Parendozoicomonas sp. Alg238-R29]